MALHFLLNPLEVENVQPTISNTRSIILSMIFITGVTALRLSREILDLAPADIALLGIIIERVSILREHVTDLIEAFNMDTLNNDNAGVWYQTFYSIAHLLEGIQTALNQFSPTGFLEEINLAEPLIRSRGKVNTMLRNVNAILRIIEGRFNIPNHLSYFGS